MKRKILSLLIIALMMVSIISCATEPEPEPEVVPEPIVTPEPEPEPEPEEELQVIEFKNLLLSTNWEVSIDGNNFFATIEEDVSYLFIISEVIADTIADSEHLKNYQIVRTSLIPMGEFDEVTFEAENPDGSIAENTTLSTIAGQQAFSRQFVGAVGGNEWFGSIVTFSDYEYIYSILFICDPNSNDLSLYTDELADFIDNIELTITPEPLPEPANASVTEGIIFEQDGITVTLKSLEQDSRGGTELNLFIENDTDDSITLQVRDVSVNDIMFTQTIFSSSVTAGNSRNDSISFASWGFERYGITEIGTIEFNFRVINDNNRNASFNSEQIYIETSLAGQVNQPLPATRELLYERDGVSIFLIDIVEGRNSVDVVFFIINDTERTLTIQARDESINGLMVSGIKSTGIMPGKVAIDTLSFSDRQLDENGISGIDGIDNVRFVLRVIDENNRNATFNTPTLEVTR